MESAVYSLIRFISFIARIYTFVIIGRAVISWVQPNPHSPIVQMLYRLTEPVLQPIRRTLSKFMGSMGNIGIDFSPIVAIVLINVSVGILNRLLLYALTLAQQGGMPS